MNYPFVVGDAVRVKNDFIHNYPKLKGKVGKVLYWDKEHTGCPRVAVKFKWVGKPVFILADFLSIAPYSLSFLDEHKHGWVDREGKWWPCKHRHHSALAQGLESSEQELEDRGWIKLTEFIDKSACVLFVPSNRLMRPTDSQAALVTQWAIKYGYSPVSILLDIGIAD